MARVIYSRIDVAGGNLFAIAARYYKDPLQWARLAQLNSLWDPWLPSSVQRVLLSAPASAAQQTGGLIGGPYIPAPEAG